MDYIYLACIDRIKAYDQLFTDAGLKTIQHFDFFKNQYIYPELHLLYKKPALFYEYRVAWRDKDRLVQKGEAQLRFHLELENYAASMDKSKNQATALQIFKYHRLVKGILHGFAQEGKFPRLGCTDEEPDLNPTTTNVHILSFSTTIEDDIALQISNCDIEEVTGEEVGLTRVPVAEEPESGLRYNID